MTTAQRHLEKLANTANQLSHKAFIAKQQHETAQDRLREALEFALSDDRSLIDVPWIRHHAINLNVPGAREAGCLSVLRLCGI